MPQRMQVDGLPDPGCVGRLVEQAIDLALGQMQPGPASGEQPALLYGHASVMVPGAPLPPLAQQGKRRRRQHDEAILAALGLLHADGHDPVAVADAQPPSRPGAAESGEHHRA